MQIMDKLKTLLLFALLLIPGFSPAETNHSSLHVALEKAVNAVLPCPHGIDIVQTSMYQHEGGQVSNMVLTAKYIKRDCTYSVNVTWSIPLRRENGDPLPLDQISRYELDLNGTIYPIAPDLTELRLEGLTGGLKVLKIRTIDTIGQESEWSEQIEVILE